MARGYRNYRGRTSKGKIALAVLLVCIILAALSALAMQRYVAYDENGNPFFRLPERQPDTTAPPPESPPAREPEEPDSLEVIVPEPEPEEVSALQVYSLTAAPLTPAAWEAARTEMGDSFGGVTVTLKDARGTVYYASQAAAGKAVKTVRGTTEALSLITGEEELHTIARLSCLPDAFAPYMNNKPMGLKSRTNGNMFRSGGTTWLDPGKPAAREYLCALAREIAELGFDEILLTNTGYPTQGDLNKLNYGSDPIEGNLSLLWQDLLRTLEPYGVKLSIELPESVISDGQEAASGLTLAGAAACADRIYAVTEPGQAGILSNLVLQGEGEKRVQDFLPELTAPDPDWDGPFLLLPAAE